MSSMSHPLRCKSTDQHGLTAANTKAIGTRTLSVQVDVCQPQVDHVIGAPETVRRGLADLLERTDADELMLTTVAFDHADRVHSCELVASLKLGSVSPA
jgi:alkanesulfonate monooxygenase SsuD/methylene tetrahydromethanopterin reductase-like flavin-dependent oxidoreductase (luciferase family)